MSAALQSLMRGAQHEEARPGALDGLLRFILIGAGGASAFVVLSSTVIWIGTGLADWIVNSICYAALIGPVYLLHRRFSFQSHAAHRQALPRYAIVQAMALVLAALFSFVIHGVLMLPTVAASMLVISLTSGVNFMVLRSWAFAQNSLGRMARA